MKKLVPLFTLLLLLPAASSVHAQGGVFNDIEVGAFGEYTQFQATHTNSVGLGGRFGLGVNRHLMLEGEIGYDFDRAFTEGFQNPSTSVITFARSNVHLLDGLAGARLQFGGRVRFFATLKGGFVHTGFSTEPGSFAGFVSTVNLLRLNDVDGAVYPGLGIESFWGPFGLRLDAGDLVYFNNGMHQDLRITFGPTIRF